MPSYDKGQSGSSREKEKKFKSIYVCFQVKVFEYEHKSNCETKNSAKTRLVLLGS